MDESFGLGHLLPHGLPVTPSLDARALERFGVGGEVFQLLVDPLHLGLLQRLVVLVFPQLVYRLSALGRRLDAELLRRSGAGR